MNPVLTAAGGSEARGASILKRSRGICFELLVRCVYNTLYVYFLIDGALGVFNHKSLVMLLSEDVLVTAIISSSSAWIAIDLDN